MTLQPVATGGSDDVEKARALVLQAREKLITAQHHLHDEGRMVPVMTCGMILEQMTELMREIGLC